MAKGYFVQEIENSKKFKNVPYLSKREFKLVEENYSIIGSTTLKKVKDDSDNPTLIYEEQKYKIKNRIFGYTKGFIILENNKECVKLKRRIPFIFFLFLIFLIWLLFFSSILKSVENEEPKIPTPTIIDKKEETDVPSVTENIENKDFKDKEINKNDTPIKENKSYVINYHSNFDENIKTEQYEYDKEFNLLKNPFSREGYSFIGWSLNKNNEIKYNDEQLVINLSSVNTEVDLYAVWKINEFEISFKDYDDTIIKSYILEYDSAVEYPSNPIRSGYIFKRWDKDISSVKQNETITAVYEINNYSINLNSNGGILEESIENYNVESSDIMLPIPTKKGYSFTGWSGTDILGKNKDVIIQKGSTGDREYTANWEANEYKISLNPDGGKSSQEFMLIKYESNYEGLPTPQKEGYDFDGWYDEKKLVTSETIMLKDYEHELISKWNLIDYNISYNLDGGTLENPILTYNVEMEDFRITNPIKKGYTFVGWNINESSNLENNLVIKQGTTGNIELKANYVPISYSIVYDANGGIGKMENTKASYNQDVRLSSNNFEYAGKKFIGWSFSKNSNVIFKDGDLINSLSSIDESVVVLYAKWETIYYNVTYYDWNNEILKEEQIPYNTETVPPLIYRRGYTFEGWDNSNFIISSDINYHPIFKRNTYTIQYDLNKDMPTDLVTIDYNIESSDVTLPTPSREGYTFVGWTGTGLTEKTKQVVIENGSVGNRVYTANWEINKYSISYNLNGGNASNLVYEYTIETDTFRLPEADKLGYTFIGWTGANGNNPSKDVVVAKGTIGNKEYIANFQINTYSITYNTSMSSLPYNPTSYNVESNTFTLNNPPKYGEFSFVGWSGTGINGRVGTLTIPKGSVGNRVYTANWYDDTPPTITGFTVKVVGRNSKGGHDIDISIDAYDNGVGIDRFETWLVPYKNGSGAGREVGATRHLGNVLYLSDPEGRTLCGYAIDRNGNEAEACYTVYD